MVTTARSLVRLMKREQVVSLFVLASVAGALLFLVGAWRNEAWTHWFLLWNLLLAWLPLIFALVLRSNLKHRRWVHWSSLVLTVLWLGFLPNAFYMITDYIHLHDVERVDYNFDALMFTTLIMTGVALGLASMVIIHRELRRRLPAVNAARAMGVVLFLVSLAIYVGRELRWNTWDLLVSPAGMLFDLSEIIIAPWRHPQLFVITLSFFTALSLLYFGIWRTTQLIRSAKN